MTQPDKINNDLEELKKEFINDIQYRLEILEKDIKNKNPYKIMHFAHKLKGSGTSFGFPELSEIGEEIEDVFKDIKWEKLNALHEKLLKIVKQV